MPDQRDPEAKAQPLTADQVRGLYQELHGLYAGRNGDYARARNLYSAQHWDNDLLEVPEGHRYTLVLNYIRPTVQKTVQLLLGQMPGIQVLPPGTDPEAAEFAESLEALLYKSWEDNEAPLVFRRVAHNMALLRRGLIYYWWDAHAEKVRFRSVAPDNFYPVYDGERLVECVIVSRRNTRALRRMYPKQASKIVPDDEGDDVIDEARWARVVNGQMDALSSGSGTTDGRHGAMSDLAGKTTVYDWYDSDGNWVRVMGDAVHRQNLDYGMGKPPVIEFPNALPGDEREPHSEIDDIRDLVLYLDQLVSQQADIIRRYANPTVLDEQSGQSTEDLRQAIQGQGGIIPLKKDGNVRFLNWDGQPPDITNQYARVLAAVYDLSGKPATSYGQVLSNQSGVATNMSLSPATTTTEEKQSIFGFGLVELNKCILRLYERFMAGREIPVRVAVSRRPGTSAWKYYDVELTGDRISGWYNNRIKWPSALRTDDPIFVQNEIAKSKADGSNPPAQSWYTTAENLGIEDVEAEKQRILSELEDPRLHPERLEAASNAMSAMAGGTLGSPLDRLPGGLMGGDPLAGADLPGGGIEGAMMGSGSPHSPKSQKDTKAKTRTSGY